jgi:hypothetical protein
LEIIYGLYWNYLMCKYWGQIGAKLEPIVKSCATAKELLVLFTGN